jgi:hypothetical protein
VLGKEKKRILPYAVGLRAAQQSAKTSVEMQDAFHRAKRVAIKKGGASNRPARSSKTKCAAFP